MEFLNISITMEQVFFVNGCLVSFVWCMHTRTHMQTCDVISFTVILQINRGQ